ncbi:dnaJ homolog subfamily C member 4 [Polyergus mexicanus]|uniref:dnaJ homolog subfamily C member 4 n=1 Tax=Polyergus mexicanus TaxID=615972 RepID=UPI0038B5B082
MMAQLFRMCKPEICWIVRNYGTHRYQDHYGTLNVSSNASQEEIRRAFLKLSKQLHPDTSGKHSHADFVKLNEAYSILGKENTRRQYDLGLKYSKSNPSYTYNSQNSKYGSQWEYEVRTAGGPWPPPQQKPNTHFGRVMALLFLGLGLVHFIFMAYSIRMKKIVNPRNNELGNEYQQTRNVAHNKSNDSRHVTENINSVKDLDKFLDKDSN